MQIQNKIFKNDSGTNKNKRKMNEIGKIMHLDLSEAEILNLKINIYKCSAFRDEKL